MSSCATQECKIALASWYDTLRETDEVWRELQAEKLLGWSSAAVEASWRRREQQFDQNASRKNNRVNFIGHPTTRKYVDFYREWLPRLSPIFGGTVARYTPRGKGGGKGGGDARFTPRGYTGSSGDVRNGSGDARFTPRGKGDGSEARFTPRGKSGGGSGDARFTSCGKGGGGSGDVRNTPRDFCGGGSGDARNDARNDARAEPPLYFADVGSSPGGMSETLVACYGWRGHAFSLASDEEGFGMAFSHADLAYADADCAQEGAWREMLQRTGAESCDFVNLGIVVDRGQKKGLAEAAGGNASIASERKRAEATAATLAVVPVEEAARAADETAAEAAAGASDTAATTAATAAEAAKASDAALGKRGLDGIESLDFVVILANELRFGLQALKAGGCLYFAFQTGGNLPLLYRLLQALRPAFARVRLTPTFAAHRTPVYIFLGEYRGVASAEGAAALAFFDSTPTSGESAFIAWHVSEWTEAVKAQHAELAPDLHHVWQLQTRRLRDDRLRAEREFPEMA